MFGSSAKLSPVDRRILAPFALVPLRLVQPLLRDLVHLIVLGARPARSRALKSRDSYPTMSTLNGFAV